MPPTTTPFASSREAQSPGPQWEGGVAAARGLTISLDICRSSKVRTGAAESGYPERTRAASGRQAGPDGTRTPRLL